MLVGFTPLGVMIGYSLAAFLLNYSNSASAWRWAFVSQAVLSIPIGIYLFFVDNSCLDIFFDIKLQREKKRKAN
jgi:MFS family permease